VLLPSSAPVSVLNKYFRFCCCCCYQAMLIPPAFTKCCLCSYVCDCRKVLCCCYCYCEVLLQFLAIIVNIADVVAADAVPNHCCCR
jgi:hypothetical protein